MSNCPTHKPLFQNKFFSLTPNPKKIELELFLSTSIPWVNTCSLPQTYPILEALLPSIFNSRCFNEEYLPFCQEVRHTEIGHLFEHILLEYLSQIKFEQDRQKVIYSGTTAWDWEKYGAGVFLIKIDAGQKDVKIVKIALEKSVYLLSKIMDSQFSSTPQTLTQFSP